MSWEDYIEKLFKEIDEQLKKHESELKGHIFEIAFEGKKQGSPKYDLIDFPRIF